MLDWIIRARAYVIADVRELACRVWWCCHTSAIMSSSNENVYRHQHVMQVSNVVIHVTCAAYCNLAARMFMLFGHIARSESSIYHCCALLASISGVPATWKRPRGCPRHTWIRTVENDLRPASIGLHTAWRRAENRSDWRTFVRTAVLQ